MAMGGGSQGGALSEINVTPLIDVLLVLIIIFMVIQPTTPKGLESLVPQPPKNKTDDKPNDRTIVLQVLLNGSSVNYKINDQSFAKDDIAPELTKIYETRQEKVMFVKGDRDLDYASVAEAIGFGKTAGVSSIAIITPQVEAGH